MAVDRRPSEQAARANARREAARLRSRDVPIPTDREDVPGGEGLARGASKQGLAPRAEGEASRRAARPEAKRARSAHPLGFVSESRSDTSVSFGSSFIRRGGATTSTRFFLPPGGIVARSATSIGGNRVASQVRCAPGVVSRVRCGCQFVVPRSRSGPLPRAPATVTARSVAMPSRAKPARRASEVVLRRASSQGLGTRAQRRVHGRTSSRGRPRREPAFTRVWRVNEARPLSPCRPGTSRHARVASRARGDVLARPPGRSRPRPETNLELRVPTR